jgi:hypothetical protein
MRKQTGQGGLHKILQQERKKRYGLVERGSLEVKMYKGRTTKGLYPVSGELNDAKIKL